VSVTWRSIPLLPIRRGWEWSFSGCRDCPKTTIGIRDTGKNRTGVTSGNGFTKFDSRDSGLESLSGWQETPPKLPLAGYYGHVESHSTFIPVQLLETLIKRDFGEPNSSFAFGIYDIACRFRILSVNATMYILALDSEFGRSCSRESGWGIFNGKAEHIPLPPPSQFTSQHTSSDW
jgi:hypothetical protein